MTRTNEKLARLLGWRQFLTDRKHHAGPLHFWASPTCPKRKYDTMYCPHFLHSVDLLIVEIDRLGLRWTIDASLGNPRNVQAYVKFMTGASLIHEQAGAEGKTPALALATALTKYLEKKP